MTGDDSSSNCSPSFQSRVALNLANFFLAETVGVVLPFLNDFLRGVGWHYNSIGIATACAGLGVFLAQTPAGILVDRIRRRRRLLAAASIVVGICFGSLPFVPTHPLAIDPLLFTAGAASAFFGPILGALALGLVGHAALSRTMGMNQSWNHAGNIAAAVVAMALVTVAGLVSIFLAVTVASILAAISVLLIRKDDLHERTDREQSDRKNREQRASVWSLFQDRRILVLFVATALFHLANAPVMPLVALYVKHLDGSDQQVGAVVLVAQTVMIPVALLSGWLCERFGRKPVFAVAFLVLPIRIFLYGLAQSPAALVALQALDGIGAGVYGVAIVTICADLTHGTGRFNTLSGIIATALALGGVIGPLASGFLVERLGFVVAFNVFAFIAAVAAAIFLLFMPETACSPTDQPPEIAGKLQPARG